MTKKANFRIVTSAVALLLIILGWGCPAGETQAADSSWTVDYWNNITLSGSPVLQRTETDLNHDWGNGSPAPGIVNNNNFSAYWRRSVYFNSGNYRFTATMDDGLRVWVDGVLIVDSWWDSQVHSMSHDLYLFAGDHLIEVKYYEATGQAVAQLGWTAVGGTAPNTFANWKGEYFNNMNLSGTPALVRDDTAVNFDWGGGSPAWNMVASDNFSVRWTRTLALQPGRYRFTVIVDDGARLWVNGQLLVDQWHDSSSGTYFAEADITSGTAVLQMAYYEHMGGAVAKLSWERLSGGLINNWRGEYYNNKNLSGASVLVRDDASVNFNWGVGTPASGIVNADSFSVRWTRSLAFNNGRYRFTVTSDDGVRLWVNNQQIINAWNDHPPQTFSGEIDLPGGSIPLKLEYYESVGGAQVQLSWVQVTAVPQPTPTPAPTSGTGVVQSYRLNVRYGPGMQYGIITQLGRGQSVTLAGYRSADGNWVMINWGGSTAWVSGLPAYLWTSVPVSNLPVWQGAVPNTGGPTTSATGRVAYCYYLNVRTGPGVSYRIIKAVPAGTITTMLGRNSTSTWAKVRLADGTIGWMSAGYLVKSVPMSSLPLVN